MVEPRPRARIRASFFPAIALEPRSGIPLYRQIYDWFRGAIVDGRLRPGQRIPSTRALASELGVSRIPVLVAFEQLQAEGYLEPRVGSGTLVARSLPEVKRRGGPRTRPRPQGPRRLSRDGKRLAAVPPPVWLHTLGAFRASLPSADHFPAAIWSRLLARHARRASMDLLAYTHAMGYLPLREAIAEYLATVRSIRADPQQIMIVTGSQQGLYLSARVLIDPEDPVWMEEPGYHGAHQAFSAFGARLVPVPVDAEGLDVEEGLRRSPSARAIYVTPSHQYPLGMTMSAARRLRLLDWASRQGAWILEDDYDSEYWFTARRPSSLHGLDADARVIYLGTFSKVLFPALRLGYVILPEDLVSAFTAAREEADICASTLTQAALTDFIREGHFARHLRRMRTLYAERRLALLAAIADRLGPDYDLLHAEAGMHLVLVLPDGLSDVVIARRAGARASRRSRSPAIIWAAAPAADWSSGMAAPIRRPFAMASPGSRPSSVRLVDDASASASAASASGGQPHRSSRDPRARSPRSSSFPRYGCRRKTPAPNARDRDRVCPTRSAL